jgi:TolB-like protein/Flp pilus assembly protein TadD
MSDAGKAVFLSYASQDAEAAKRICEALRAAGVVVWFDQSELVGGDAWDQKIRRQIKDCALLIPIISANTQSRAEGYFRLEWRLADQRTHLMGRNKAFLLPVSVDGTTDADADVPESFAAVQWTKLPRGETPPAFCARVKKLLDGDAVGGALRPDSSEPSGLKAPPTIKPSPRWLAPVIAGAVIALLALIFARPWEKTPPAPAGASPAPTPVAAPQSEARKLTERARTLSFEHNARRADFDNAALLLEQAAKLDPNDATVWAVSAMLDARYIDESYDNSDTRRAAATHHADRAFALDATSRDARFARAFALTRASNYSREASAEGAAVFRALLAEDPGDAAALTSLAFAKQTMGELDESLQLFAQLARFPGEAGHAAFCRALSYWNARRYREALEEVTQAVKLEPTAPALLLKGQIEMLWLGDLERARDSLAALPASALLEDGPATFAAWVHFFRREYDLALGDLARVPREFVASPMGVLARATDEALILRAAGRGEGAEAKARIALASVERRLVNEPNSRELSYERIMLLGLLGRGNEARAHLKLFRELLTGEWRPDPGLYMMIDDKEAALGEFHAIIANPRAWTAATIRLDPLYDPLRTDPRFQAILAQAERDPRMSPTAELKTEDGGQRTAQPADAKSVAVLAFANLSDDKANEYFSDGISEELLNVLAKIPGLKVAARTSAFYFKGKEVPIPEIAKQLGVAYVVEGSVRKAGDKVRITAQLIKATDGFHVWSDTFTRDLKDIFAVQDEIAGLIAKNLELRMGMVAARPTVDLEAYQEYLTGRALFAKAGNGDLLEAVRHFEKAVAIDPSFTAAWVQLARAHTQLGRWGGAPTLQAWSAARVAIDHARALEPDSPDVLLALGWILRTADWDWRGAEQAFRRSLQLRPDQPDALAGLAVLLFNLGKKDEAFLLGQQAVRLDPLNAGTQIDLSLMFYLNDNWAEAEQVARRALQLAPGGGTSYHCILAWSLIKQGRLAEAEAEVGRDSDAIEKPTTYGLLALARGQAAVAREKLAELEEISRTTAGLADLQNSIAWLGVGLGEKDRPFAALEKARDSRDPSISWLRSSPYLAPLYGDPRWNALLHQVGLADEQLK